MKFNSTSVAVFSSILLANSSSLHQIVMWIYMSAKITLQVFKYSYSTSTQLFLRFPIADGGNVGAGEGEGPPLHFSKKDSSKTIALSRCTSLVSVASVCIHWMWVPCRAYNSSHE